MILQIKMRKFAKKFRCAAIKLGFLSFTRAFAFRNFEKHILGQENFSSEGVFSIRQTSSVKNEPNYIYFIIVKSIRCAAIQLGVHTEKFLQPKRLFNQDLARNWL